MAENKKGFILYADLIHTIELIDDEKAGALFKYILKYVNDENPESEDMLLNVLFEPIKRQLKRDLIKFEERVEKNRINGSKGGAPKGNSNAKKAKTTQNNQSVVKKKKNNPKQHDTDTDTDTDTIIVEEKKTTTSNPSLVLKIKPLIIQLKKEDSWKELMCMNHKIPPDKIDFMLDKFEVHLISDGFDFKTLKDGKSHFNNWVRKKPNENGKRISKEAFLKANQS